MHPNVYRLLSRLCLAMGLVSIGASIGVWALWGEGDRAHAERLGIFVGLWAPTFIMLSLVCAKLGPFGQKPI